MRVVLDTNVFISGIFWEGNYSSQIIDLWRKGKIELICSVEMIEEFVNTLLSFKIKMPLTEIDSWKNLIIENSTIVDAIKDEQLVIEDKDDAKFIEAGITGEADYIISQDKHLLNIKEYKSIKILSPKQFLEIIKIF